LETSHFKKHLRVIRDSSDKSICEVVKTLENPLRHIALEQFNYVAFEGNIGAGKTTLATKIAEDFNAKTVRALCGQSLSTKVL
jgi:tRNA A37 threonylcarbamoyladenosine biosynthesis protein TsaE